MSKSDKVFYGIFSFLPLALIIGFFISIMGSLQALMDSAAWNSGHPRKILPYLPDFFSSAFTLVILMLITTIALLITFITHVSKNKSIAGREQIIWITLFLVAGPLTFPVYFFIRIWHGRNDLLTQTLARKY